VIDVTAIAGLLPIEGGILATLAPVLVRRGGLGGGLSKVGSESSSVSVLSNPTLPKLDIECRGGGCGACTAVSAGPIVEVLLAGEVGAAKCAGLRATAGLDLRFAGFAAIGGGLATAGVPVPLATGVVSLDGTGFLFEDSEGELAEAMVAAPKFALVVVLRGGGGGGPSVWEAFASSTICIRPTLAGRVDGLYGGGSFLGPELDADDDSMEWVMFSKGDVDMLENEDIRDSDLGMLTQSGSSDNTYGLACRLGLRIVWWAGLSGLGGLIPDRAILPPSSHHFCLSELAAGRPGSMAS